MLGTKLLCSCGQTFTRNSGSLWAFNDFLERLFSQSGLKKKTRIEHTNLNPFCIFSHQIQTDTYRLKYCTHIPANTWLNVSRYVEPWTVCLNWSVLHIFQYSSARSFGKVNVKLLYAEQQLSGLGSLSCAVLTVYLKSSEVVLLLHQDHWQQSSPTARCYHHHAWQLFCCSWGGDSSGGRAGHQLIYRRAHQSTNAYQC